MNGTEKAGTSEAGGRIHDDEGGRWSEGKGRSIEEEGGRCWS